MVEGFNGYAKDGNHEQPDKSDNRRVRGFAASAIAATFALMASNCRKVQEQEGSSGLGADDPIPIAA